MATSCRLGIIFQIFDFCVLTVKYIIENNAERNDLKHNDNYYVCIVCAYLHVNAHCLCVHIFNCMWKPQVRIRYLPLLSYPLFFEIGFRVGNSVVLASQQALKCFCI